MEKKIYLLCMSLSLCAFICISSCQKDFLTKKPLNSYSDQDVWSDLNLVKTYVNSKYRSLPHFYYWETQRPSATGLSSASDEGYNKFDYEGEFLWNLGQVSPDNLSLDAWKADYTYIRDCNIFFQHINAVKGDSALKKRLTGEMKFIRAWCYFDLISRYGGVPLITKVYSLSDSSFLVSRNTYAECMNFVINELDDAAGMLPVSYSGTDIGRITKGAALALKSRALLYAASPLNNPSNDKNKWQAAADAAKAVINLADQGVYSLYQGDDYKQIFLKEFNSEVILSYDINGTSPNPGLYGDFDALINVMIAPNGYHGWSVYTPTQNLVDQFEMKNGKVINDPGSGYDPAHPYQNRDPRFYADILYNGAQFRERACEYFKGGLDSPQSTVESWNSSLTGYNWRKYADESVKLTESIGSSQNFIIFRLAEIYLNYAEAEYELGDEPIARKYLNLIRSRASVNMPAVTASGTDLLKAIRHEREIELCFEGQRFFDVRRWKIAMQTENQPIIGVHIIKDQNGKYSYSYFTLQNRKFYPQNYLFPIPKYETDKNKLLAQNPGY